MKFAFKENIEPKEIINIRKKLNLKHKELASFLNINEKTLRNWESEGDLVKGPAVVLLQMLKYNPGLIDKYKVNDNNAHYLRIYYYDGNNLCAVIDADYKNDKVIVKNYVDNIYYKPFGRNENPTIKDFDEFLESRCVPKQRADIKQYLKQIDVPFYDPLMIIEKTEGRCTEDNFSLRIERIK